MALYLVVLLLVAATFAGGSVGTMTLAARGRYLCDLLAVIFLVTASRKGWRFWAPILLLLVLARGFWILAAFQRWPMQSYIDTGIYLFVPAIYIPHFIMKKGKALIDWLKLIWILALSVLGLGQGVWTIYLMTPAVSYLTSALLQVIVFLQWRKCRATPIPVPAWDFDLDGA